MGIKIKRRKKQNIVDNKEDDLIKRLDENMVDKRESNKIGRRK